MKITSKHYVALLTLSFISSVCFADFKKGDKIQTLSALHPDSAKQLLYTLNYQLQGMVIPPCTEVTVTDVSKSKMKFDWNGVEMTVKSEKHTKKAGVSFQQALSNYFGESCDKAKLDSLSKIDKEGIRLGIVKNGMTKDGVLFAMGRPPIHANPDLSMPTWTYWINRWKRKLIDFNEDGVVVGTRL